jgi:hypothetical protein
MNPAAMVMLDQATLRKQAKTAIASTVAPAGAPTNFQVGLLVGGRVWRQACGGCIGRNEGLSGRECGWDLYTRSTGLATNLQSSLALSLATLIGSVEREHVEHCLCCLVALQQRPIRCTRPAS